MKTILSEINGGVLITFEKKLPLSDEQIIGLREKWENMNEDGEVDDLLNEASEIASPKAFVKPLTIEQVAEDYVILSGIKFESTILPGKFEPILNKGSGKVYGFVGTCGRELHDWAANMDDILLRCVADDICLAYLGVISEEAHSYVKDNFYGQQYFTRINPGSLKSWPISGQIPLFKVLGEGADATGVTLTDSMLMIPFKSSSGIFFESEHTFESCQLCDKLDCPNRRAARIEE